jgi:hypothetical protein
VGLLTGKEIFWSKYKIKWNCEYMVHDTTWRPFLYILHVSEFNPHFSRVALPRNVTAVLAEIPAVFQKTAAFVFYIQAYSFSLRL